MSKYAKYADKYAKKIQITEKTSYSRNSHEGAYCPVSIYLAI